MVYPSHSDVHASSDHDQIDIHPHLLVSSESGVLFWFLVEEDIDCKNEHNDAVFTYVYGDDILYLD
jgi:hypothetical protein